MTLRISTSMLLCWLLIIPVFFSACIKDTCEREEVYSMYRPVYKSRAEVLAGVKSEPAREIKNPGKIYIRGKYIFLNDLDRGIHIIDNSNPSSPRRIAFIPIPGNVDLAVKGDYLYADMYTQLLTIDISNPMNVSVKDNKWMFPQRAYQSGFYTSPDIMVVDWIRKDTTVIQNCDNPGFLTLQDAYVSISSSGSSPFGSGGSMARFTIINDHMYTVGSDSLNVLDISTPQSPAKKTGIKIGWGIETIYPFDNQLFVGSTTGMFRFDLSNPALPVMAGQFSHIQSCDPVIADKKYAYVTLRSGSRCQGFTNELNILSLAPTGTGSGFTLLKRYELTNPHGLAKDGNLLMICDGTDGLKAFDATDINQLKPVSKTPMDAYDVIMSDKLALVVAKDGLYQFDYSDPSNIRQLSRIDIRKN